MTARRPVEADFEAVLALVQAADEAVIGESDWTAADLRREWDELELEGDAWVLELDGRLAAYASLSHRRGGRFVADGYVHPELRGRGCGSELLRLTEEAARARAGAVPEGTRVYLQNATLLGGDDACIAALYARHGYAPVRRFWRMVADLAAEPALPALPPGFSVEPYDPERDARAVHAAIEEAFEDHWDHTRRTWEEWRQRHLVDDRYDPSLWFVIRDGDEIAGACLAKWKTEGDWGLVDTLGVRRPWRRRGFGEALLAVAFRAFWERGERSVALGVDAESPTGATRLYERAGMRVFWRAVVYEKELRPADLHRGGSSEKP